MNMKGQVQRSLRVLRRSDREGVIPMEVLHYARGIVFMTQIKGAWLFSGTLGTGIFMKRLSANKWSPPASIVMTSVGVGLQAGGQKADIVIVLNDESSVRAFEAHGQLKLGGDYAISAGPLGRTIKAELGVSGSGFNGMFSYSMSQGLFVGISLEGVLLVSRGTDNRGFYGTRHAHLRNIADGEIKVPSGIKAEWVAALHHVLKNLCAGRRFDDGLDELRNDPELFAELEGGDADQDAGRNPRDDDDLVQKQREKQRAAPGSKLTRRMTQEEHAMAEDGRNILADALNLHDTNAPRSANAAPARQASSSSSGDLLGLEDYYAAPSAAPQAAAYKRSASSSSSAAPPPPPPPPQQQRQASIRAPIESDFVPRAQGAPLSAPLAYGSTKVYVTKDHIVNESDPAMTAHNIIAVRRGDPLFMLDGSLQSGLPYPYSDYVSVQRLSDGQTGKVSRYCLAYSM